MWMRGVAVRPVPVTARITRSALDAVARNLWGNEDTRLPPLYQRFEAQQPALAAHVRALLARNMDVAARAMGTYLTVCVWSAFRDTFGSKLGTVPPEAILATEEALRVEDELRRNHAEEPLDLDDVVLREQPDAVGWVHEQVDAITEVDEDDGRAVDVDDLHFVYRTILALVLSLSYAVAVPGGDATEEIEA